MNKKSLRRMAAAGTAVLIAAGSVVMFAGCTTSNNPEVTITYSFNGKDYEVEYVLSRIDAPRTVQHFIELADAGYYNGFTADGVEYKFVVHDYEGESGTRLYTGGYGLGEDGLVEADYFSIVNALSGNGTAFTQTVWKDEARTQPLYSVYGEFSENGVEQENGRDISATTGALVMYYTPKLGRDGNGNRIGADEEVWVERIDGGSANDGEKYQLVGYEYNSATSMFYTFTGETMTESDSYCVFGKVKNYEEQMTDGLLAAIEEYKETLDEDASFTQTMSDQVLNRYDVFENVQKGNLDADFETPVDTPIYIKSVKVTKY